MTIQQDSSTPVAGQPVPTLDPETVVSQLRAMRGQIGEIAPMSAHDRDVLRRRGKTTNPILQASINVIGAFDQVAQAVATPAVEVRQLYDEANRWTAVEDELRSMLNGVAGANLMRRYRIALIAAQAYNIGTQLARDPANAMILPHVQEIKRLRRLARGRKQQAAAPQSPDAEPEAPGSTKP